MAGRKRLRQNTVGSSSASSSTVPSRENAPTSLGPTMSEPALLSKQEASLPATTSTPNDDRMAIDQTPQKSVRKSRSWYGSLPGPPKAAASTSVARENILGGTVKSSKRPGLNRFEQKSSETASVHTVPAMPSLSEAPENAPTPPPVEGITNAPTAPTGENEPQISTAPENSTENKEFQTTTAPAPASEGAEPPRATVPQSAEPPATPQRPASSSNWLGWLSKTPFTESQPALTATATPKTKPQAKETKDTVSKEVETATVGTQDESDAQVTKPPDSVKKASTQPVDTASVKAADPTTPQKPTQSGSWFGLWPSNAEKTKTSPAKPSQPDTKPSDASEDVVMEDAPPPQPQETPPKPQNTAPKTPDTPSQQTPKAGSTWAFWSKDSPKSSRELPRHESGEIAVIGEGSEAHPKPMTEGDVSGTSPRDSKDSKQETKPKDIQTAGRSTWRRNKRVRPASMEVSPSSSPAKSTMAVANQASAAPAQDVVSPTSPAKPESLAKTALESVAQAKLPPNLILPSFSSTYKLKENPSIITQIAQLLLRTSQPPANHVYRATETPKIRKAIAIGVHGLFPAAYLRPMIGQPTGTSLRFANLCADSIRKWADENGCSDCEIEKVALEGEGKIGERVENLWRLLLNWMEHLRSADLIIMASHSQGVPVSVMLLEKLIDLGIITNAKIGVCAMAGVALGPFPEYKSSILIGSAAELWEFGNPESANSQRFEAALKRILDYGARVTFVGSIDDQLVPMESAVYSPANHPYIYRAVFIDGRVHASDFIAHLVGFALKLRNLGISDHGLIRELSLPLAGSLYGGEGHSRIYYDSAVYDLAISHTLETTTAATNTTFEASKRDPLSAPNPYVLPWIMRGLLEEDFVKTELSSETAELLRQFDDWKPTTKALKDVKYRLEAVRSRL